ncbi:hypothetical protein C8R44DRAFT_612008 [Mycena epipterygia]|nr:hypothetical protein C8R44DRAFT_612008 [Mycena epipterygia]
MRERVNEEKRKAVRRYEEVHKHTIKDYDFKPGSLVLVRNTTIEKSLNTKMHARYMGPMIVVRRTKGGSYLCCEMDGAMFHGKIGQFRVVPFEQRTKIEIPDNILDLIDLSKEVLDELAEDDNEPDEYLGKDMQFHRIRIRPSLANDDDNSDTESYMSDDAPELDLEEVQAEFDPEQGPRRSKRLRA